MTDPATPLAEPERSVAAIMDVQPASVVHLGRFGTYQIGSQRYDRNGRQIIGRAGETGMVLDDVVSALPGPVFVCSCLLGGGADVVVPANDCPADQITVRTTHHASHAAALQFALAESNLISGVDE